MNDYMLKQVLADALTFHAREEQRLTGLLNRRRARWFGPNPAYAEAAYAHRAARVHLRRLAFAAGVDPEVVEKAEWR